MQFGNIDFSSLGLSEIGINAEQLRPVTVPKEVDRANQVYQQTRKSLEDVAEAAKPSSQELEEVTKQLNAVTESLNIKLRFSVEKGAMGTIHVQMINTETNEVIREIPPKKMTFVGSRLLDAVGIIIDELA